MREKNLEWKGRKAEKVLGKAKKNKRMELLKKWGVRNISEKDVKEKEKFRKKAGACNEKQRKNLKIKKVSF